MTGDDRPIAETAYDQLADRYEAEVETSPYNEDLAHPGTTTLVPDVDGDRVLDAGCGAGAYAEWLLDGGADVIGVDISTSMLARARDRLPERAPLCRMDLGSALGFEDDAFDGVVSGLVLGYVADWGSVFEEFRRVLRPGGFLVVAVGHPFDEFPLPDDADYFAVERRVKEWAVDVPYYRRPLSAMVGPLLEAGFRLEALTEPRPTERFRERWPERYERESRRPVFLCLRGRAPATRPER